MYIEEIIHQFKHELLSFVKKRISDEDAAKEVHQEILIKVFTAYPGLKNQESLKFWIYRIARNAITDYFRKSKHLSGDLPEDYPEEPEVEDSLEEELKPCIKPFLKQLRPNYKYALEMTESGKTQKELADLMQISYSGAKSTVQRARKELRKIFEQCCNVEADVYGNIMSVKKKPGCDCP